MKMISMHHEPGEGEQAIQAMPDYPYGLRLTLNNEQLEALGIDLPSAGTGFHIEAMATVTRASTEDPDADGDVDNVCLELQITELGMKHVSDPEEDKDSAADRLYGPKEG